MPCYPRKPPTDHPPMPRPRRPKPDRRRALELLASCRDGCTEAIMLAHGITVEMLVELARVRITEAGRRALAATEQHR